MSRVSQVRTYGPHLLVTCYGCNSSTLMDVDAIRDFISTLPEKVQMRALGEAVVEKIEDRHIAGVTGVQMIIESHITIHTYAGQGFVAFDLFSCKEFNAGIVLAELMEFVQATKVSARVIPRGREFPTHLDHLSEGG